jgi:hypothetical protein
MPKRPSRNSDANTPPRPPGDFRRRYDAVEARRESLIARVHALGDQTKAHPGYRRALTLLNDTFRKAKLAQRAAVLESAAWLIVVLERLAAGL